MSCAGSKGLNFRFADYSRSIHSASAARHSSAKRSCVPSGSGAFSGATHSQWRFFQPHCPRALLDRTNYKQRLLPSTMKLREPRILIGRKSWLYMNS